MTIFDELPALSPVQFFALSWGVPYLHKKILLPEHRLPSTASLTGEEEFAEIFMGWTEEKLSLFVRVNGRTPQDSVELFFDTRDLKSKARVSKFCHHFIFTPDEKDGFFGREITRFCNEDIHRLCDPKDLEVVADGNDSSYSFAIEIPARCLYGYDPLQFNRLGFTYRISRSHLPPQHFAIISEEFAVEQHPSLWATLQLGKKP